MKIAGATSIVISRLFVSGLIFILPHVGCFSVARNALLGLKSLDPVNDVRARIRGFMEWHW